MIKKGNRPIALFGCGYEGHRLFWDFNNKGIKISYVVDNKRTDDFWGNHVYRLEEILEQRPLFLISSEKYYAEIKNQLEAHGQKEFDDFVKGSSYNKEIVLINANCYGPIYSELLNSNAEFSSKYFVYDHLAFYNVIEGERDKRVLKNIDICITQDIEDTERNHYFSEKYIRSQVSGGAKVIVVPNLVGYGRIFYPQYGELNKNSSDEWNKIGLFKYSDRIIDESINKKMTKEEIIKKISKGCVFDRHQLEMDINEIEDRFKKREERWDIKILSDIKSISHDNQTFYDPQHPTNLIFELIVKRLLRLLGINNTDIICTSHLGWDEMPVYPEVAKFLGLNWWYPDMEIRRNSNLKLCRVMKTNEYVSEYVDWCYERNNMR